MSEREEARRKSLEQFQRKIGYKFTNLELLDVALTHSSYAYESGSPLWNERLEFLGDAVLGVIISEELFRNHADASEGELTREKSLQVRDDVLSAWGHSLGIGDILRAGKGQRRNVSENMIGNAVEAVIAALYIDGGLEAARKFVSTRPQIAPKEFLDAKSRLQILTQERVSAAPRYELISRTGSEHAPSFSVRAILNGEEISTGTGSSRKSAEQDAAKKALEIMQQKLP